MILYLLWIVEKLKFNIFKSLFDNRLFLFDFFEILWYNIYTKIRKGNKKIMTREKAYEATSVLGDIYDFELFMDEIEGVYNNTEGNFDEFYHNELFPLLKKEMDRRLKILEEL